MSSTQRWLGWVCSGTVAHEGARSAELDDTDPKAKQVQLDLLRRLGPTGRFALARSLTTTVLCAQRDEILRANPGLSDEQLRLLLIARWYGQALADRVRASGRHA